VARGVCLPFLQTAVMAFGLIQHANSAPFKPMPHRPQISVRKSGADFSRLSVSTTEDKK